MLKNEKAKPSKERLGYLDISKGIGILAITIGHISRCALYEAVFFTYFKVAIFFMVTGIIENQFKDASKEYLFRRIKRLTKIYFGSSIFLILWFAMVAIANEGDVLDTIKSNIIITMRFDGINTLWFISTLLISEVLFFLYKKYFQGAFICSIIFIFYMINNSIYLFDNILLRNVGRAFYGLFFMVLGAVFDELLIKRKFIERIPVFGVLFLFGCFLISRKNGIIDFRVLNFGHFCISFLGGALLGCIGVLILSYYFQYTVCAQIIALVGRESLTLMIIQIILIPIIRNGWYEVFLVQEKSILWLYISSFFIMCIIVLVNHGITCLIKRKGEMCILSRRHMLYKI